MKNNLKKLFKSGLALALVIAMLATLAGCANIFGEDPATEDPDAALQAVVKDNANSWANKLGDAFSNAGNKEMPTLADSKISVNVTVGDVIIEALEQSFAQSAGTEMDFSFLSNINFNVETDTSGEMDKVQMLIGLNGQQVVTLNLLMNMTEYLFYAGSPELSDTYIEFDGSEMMGDVAMPVNPGAMMSGGNIAPLLEALPDKATLTSIVDRYTAIMLTAIKNVEFGTTTLEVNGISEECSQFTLNVYEQDAINIIKSVLTTAKDDAELKVVIEDLAAAIEEMSGTEMGAEDVYTTFQEYVNDVLEQFNEIEDIDSENPLKIYAYMNKAGEINGCKIIMPESETAAFYTYEVTDGASTAFVFAVPSEMSDVDYVNFSGVLTDANGKTNGTLTFTMEGTVLAQIELKDMDADSGTITLKPSNELLQLMLGTSALPFSDLALELKFSAGTTELNFLTGTELLLGFSAKIEDADGLDFGIPSDTVDAMDSNAMQNWANSLVLDTVFENLKNAGAGDFVELIESLLNESAAA